MWSYKRGPWGSAQYLRVVQTQVVRSTNGRVCSQPPMWLPAAETTAQEVCPSGGCQSPQPWGFALAVLNTNHGFVLNIVKEEPQYNKNPVVMVDEVMSSSPPKFTFPEAGLRVMITNKFGPRTRLRMASRIIINEVSFLQGP